MISKEFKIRNIPHVEGNFATFVFIKVNPSKSLKNFFKTIREVINPNELGTLQEMSPDELHISLTKTMFIKYHQIDSLVNKLKNVIQSKFKLIITNKLKHYSNEHNTRYFLSLLVAKNKFILNLNEKIKILFESLGIENSTFKVCSNKILGSRIPCVFYVEQSSN